MITAGVSLVVAVILAIFILNGPRETTNLSPEAMQAREEAALRARVESDWQRVKVSRSSFWGHYVADAPQHLVPFAGLLRRVAEGHVCKENPSVDGKMLSYEELEKVAILREYQCLEYAREDLIRAANSDEGTGFLGSTMALLREEYQKPIPPREPETQPGATPQP